MKKILLLCCLMAVGSGLLFAQAVTVSNVSKTDFDARVTHFSKLLDQNKEEAAKAEWKEVNNMMMSELDAIKQKVKSNAGDKAKQEKYTSMMQHQYEVYLTIVRAHGSLLQNKAEIQNKLSEFEKGML